MLLIIGLTFDHPVPCFHGLLAISKVFLRGESGLIGTDLREIDGTSCHSGCDGREAGTNLRLFGGDRSRTLDFLAQVHAVTVRVLGGRYAVGTKEHFVARVLTVLARFAECAGYTVDTGTPFYICHFVCDYGKRLKIIVKITLHGDYNNDSYFS